MKALIVTGDVKGGRERLGRMLMTHELLFAGDPLEALARLSEHRDVDVVLLDFTGTRTRGFDVLQRLSGNPAVGHIPIVVAGADDTLLRSVQSALSGCPITYLTIPYRRDELLAALRSAIRRSPVAAPTPVAPPLPAPVAPPTPSTPVAPTPVAPPTPSTPPAARAERGAGHAERGASHLLRVPGRVTPARRSG